jgi:hypothetical protein
VIADRRPRALCDELGLFGTSPVLGMPLHPLLFQQRIGIGLGLLDHVDMSAVDALKQQNRGEPVVEPGQLPGELHARRATTTDQPRLWLVVHV